MMVREWIPNALTLIRLVGCALALFFLWRLQFSYSLIVHLICAGTDFADGFFARRWNCESRLGSFLDAGADKIYVLSLFTVLTIWHRCPMWFLGLTLSTALLQSIAFVWLLQLRRLPILIPSRLGKSGSCFQFLWIAWLLYDLGTPHLPLPFIDLVYAVLGGIQTYACIRYFVQYRPRLFPGLIMTRPTSQA